MQQNHTLLKIKEAALTWIFSAPMGYISWLLFNSPNTDFCGRSGCNSTLAYAITAALPAILGFYSGCIHLIEAFNPEFKIPNISLKKILYGNKQNNPYPENHEENLRSMGVPDDQIRAMNKNYRKKKTRGGKSPYAEGHKQRLRAMGVPEDQIEKLKIK